MLHKWLRVCAYIMLTVWFYWHWESQVFICVHMCSEQGMKTLWVAEYFTPNPMIICFKLNEILNFKTRESFFDDPVFIVTLAV
jgi:hypothetical protein